MSNLEEEWIQQALEGMKRHLRTSWRPTNDRSITFATGCWATRLTLKMLPRKRSGGHTRTLSGMTRPDLFPPGCFPSRPTTALTSSANAAFPILSVDLLPEEDAPDPAPNPEKVVGELEESSQMRRLLGKLGTQDRAAVILRYWYEFSEEEIARSTLA